MINQELLRKQGIDYAAGMERFMNDESLYEAVLTAFVKDAVLSRARTAFDAGDTEGLFSAIHEAKGSSGNADLTEVYERACALVNLLRSGSYTPAELSACYKSFEDTYSAVRDGIRAALGI